MNPVIPEGSRGIFQALGLHSSISAGVMEAKKYLQLGDLSAIGTIAQGCTLTPLFRWVLDACTPN